MTYIISIHALLAESDPHLISCTSIGRPFLSTLSLRRATMINQTKKKINPAFLSTLSLRRATPQNKLVSMLNSPFLSTLSLRRATRVPSSTVIVILRISIHALLAESDYTHPISISVCIIFLSTLSLRRATIRRAVWAYFQDISIHALLAESDPGRIWSTALA